MMREFHENGLRKIRFTKRSFSKNSFSKKILFAKETLQESQQGHGMIGESAGINLRPNLPPRREGI
jgi:hypothetical protein